MGRKGSSYQDYHGSEELDDILEELGAAWDTHAEDLRRPSKERQQDSYHRLRVKRKIEFRDKTHAQVGKMIRSRIFPICTYIPCSDGKPDHVDLFIPAGQWRKIRVAFQKAKMDFNAQGHRTENDMMISVNVEDFVRLCDRGRVDIPAEKIPPERVAAARAVNSQSGARRSERF